MADRAQIVLPYVIHRHAAVKLYRGLGLGLGGRSDLGFGSFLHILIFGRDFSEIELGLTVGLKLLEVRIEDFRMPFADSSAKDGPLGIRAARFDTVGWGGFCFCCDIGEPS
jgi:hypothetical protein